MGDEHKPKVVLQACTREQIDKWTRLAETRPARAVAVLKLGPIERTPQGDTVADIIPALIAVRTIACGIARGGDKTSRKLHPAWKSLVDAGIVQALCDVVRVGKMAVPEDAVVEGVSREDLVAAAQGLPSLYHEPLHALGGALRLMSDNKHSAADRKFLTTLKRKWKEMMQRIWDEPANTLSQEDDNKIHQVERGAVARIVRDLSVVDPPFLAIIYDPEDYTIPVIARAWAHATGGSDSWDTMHILQNLMFPVHPKTMEYVSTHPIPPLHKILERVYLGCSPPSTFAPTAHGRAFVAAVANAARSEHTATAELVPNFLMLVLAGMEEDDDCGREVALAMQQSQPLWEAFFDLIRRTAVKADPMKKFGWQGVLGCMANTLGSLSKDAPREREPLVRLWTEAGFWDVLDERAPAIVMQPAVSMFLVRMFLIMDEVVQAGTPALEAAMSRQFPRAVIIGKLLRKDLILQKMGSRPNAPRGSGIEFRQAHGWDQMAWQMLAKLQFTCRNEGECNRRGCEKDAVEGAECATCKKARYCGEQCQKTDKEEHETVCGWQDLLEKSEF